jgi:hypothetical protein
MTCIIGCVSKTIQSQARITLKLMRDELDDHNNVEQEHLREHM